ncbi:ADP-ribose pyrophosphatase YjhB, NUDIX family [Micromonospora pallida]|uniref:ADP-ribose pyrophosphatase YjhB, NUDIX family n=1 Tax=Micromonospora pallida TaxID=145854 RepID=A0A1C6RN85_9ACTN|nr:NUDIX domain-containing protein [Micromonospora pallida]SCL18663.1 ADP-ribose pyrophosphatase YjhB, NUDIX family [Micromonospora pallida]
MKSLTWAVAAVVTDDAGRVLLCRQSRPAARWALPGGRFRPDESPQQAVVRDVHAETGLTVEVVDLVGIYHLPTATDTPPAGPQPDVLVHVLRARVSGDAPPGVPGAGCRVSWHDPDGLPDPLTPVTRCAVADATAGHSGLLRALSPTPPDPAATPDPAALVAPPAAPVPRRSGGSRHREVGR